MTKFLEKKESQDTVDIVDKKCMERNECTSLSEKQEPLSSKPASSASASVIKADSDKIQAVAPVLAKISQPEDVGNESNSGGDSDMVFWSFLKPKSVFLNSPSSQARGDHE